MTMASTATSSRTQASGFSGAASLAALVTPQLKAVDALFARELASDLPHVNDLVTHVAKLPQAPSGPKDHEWVRGKGWQPV